MVFESSLPPINNRNRPRATAAYKGFRVRNAEGAADQLRQQRVPQRGEGAGFRLQYAKLRTERFHRRVEGVHDVVVRNYKPGAFQILQDDARYGAAGAEPLAKVVF